MATEIAHCGACAQRMVLIETADAWWYVCTNPACGEQTPPRATAAAAAEDVVWVPAERSRRNDEPKSRKWTNDGPTMNQR